MKNTRNAIWLGLLFLLSLRGVAQYEPPDASSEPLAHLTSHPRVERRAPKAQVSVKVGMEKQLFASYILATAALNEPNDAYTLGDGDGLVAVFVQNPTPDTHVRVEIGATPFSDAAVYEGTMQEAGRQYQVTPRLAWNYQKLRALQQPTPINLTITTYIDEIKAGHRTVVATLRSVNDCPYFWEEKGNPTGGMDLNYMYTAYINEDDPVVDQILAEALKTGIVTGFDGYQSGNPKTVDEQVFSIWYALQKRGVRYSSISTNSSTGSSARLYSQRIRLIDQTWNVRQANCADAMVLFASVLRSIHIEPVLVLFPDHCFLGYYRDDDRRDFVCLETSMVGELNLAKIPVTKRVKTSRQMFATARARAQRQYNELKEIFASRKEPHYRFITVADERKAGIRPIGRASDSF
ncbi:hypothetical protein [Tellurirhabdus rosea]|uniref:hypothetical protein n=1 Tax=Tellurirhabdus rosea TaxID=2674997 RepID=UPI00225064FE|nr:hypothetical protein [Tellurirhabdus rosea]